MKDDKILIVDDEQGMRYFVSRYLKHIGYNNVETACDTKEALEVFQKENHSLLIIDIHMPGESGLVLMEKAKKLLPDTVFIIVTASDDLCDAVASLNLGADRYLLKPINDDELQHAVKNSLEKRRLVLENREYKKMLAERTTENRGTNKTVET